MSIARSVSDVIQQHVTLQVESLDRIYLNVYQPRLQYDRGVASFFRFHRGHAFASSALMEPISKAFIADVERFVKQRDVPLLTFRKGERKEDIVLPYRQQAEGREQVLVVGKAQEKTPVFRTERRRHPETGAVFPWIVKTTAMVNHFYFYCLDDDFGPFFLKVCTYFPYNAKLCLNGHEYLKRQLAKEQIAFEELDNGILSCANPERMQELADGLSAEKIEALLRKWQKILPQPFSAEDNAAGYCYDVSILQCEFALTQVLDQPLTGRVFFEEVIRENLDIGRPDQVQLIFNRRVTKRTPGRFRTRVLTAGVVPSLHVDYKHSKIKQYHKEGRALRTETTINEARDFGIGKRLQNLSALRKVGFEANRRLLNVQKISQDCAIGETVFQQMNSPVEVSGQRASPLRFGDVKVQTLFSVLLVFRLLVRGFSNRDLREHWAPLLGTTPESLTSGQMTYQLRRLRLHGLIQRIPKTHRYCVTDSGWRTILFYNRIYNRVLRPGLAQVCPSVAQETTALRKRVDQLDATIQDLLNQQKLAL